MARQVLIMRSGHKPFTRRLMLGYLVTISLYILKRSLYLSINLHFGLKVKMYQILFIQITADIPIISNLRKFAKSHYKFSQKSLSLTFNGS